VSIAASTTSGGHLWFSTSWNNSGRKSAR